MNDLVFEFECNYDSSFVHDDVRCAGIQKNTRCDDRLSGYHLAYHFDSCTKFRGHDISFRTILGENRILQMNTSFLFQSTWKQKLMIWPLSTGSLVMILIPFLRDDFSASKISIF